jgi:hypothetical protein
MRKDEYQDDDEDNDGWQIAYSRWRSRTFTARARDPTRLRVVTRAFAQMLTLWQ